MGEYTSDWVSPRTAHWRRHLGHLRGKTAHGLEIGSYEGRSAVWWFENILTHPDSRLSCIDVWSNAEIEARFQANTNPFAERLTVIKKFSGAALRKLPMHGFDFVYVDGAHEGMNVLEDAILAWRLLKVGGILVFDDYEFTNEKRTIQPKPAIDAFVAIYPVTVLHKAWQVILRKDRENHSYHG